MKEIIEKQTIETVRYVAEDGAEFDTPDACLEYEEDVLQKYKLREYFESGVFFLLDFEYGEKSATACLVKNETELKDFIVAYSDIRRSEIESTSLESLKDLPWICSVPESFPGWICTESDDFGYYHRNFYSLDVFLKQQQEFLSELNRMKVEAEKKSAGRQENGT